MILMQLMTYTLNSVQIGSLIHIINTRINILLTSILQKKLNGICQPHSQHCTGKNSNPVISMCSLNVCGFNSKLKYHVLQQYMQLFDFICLLETKCNSIDENELSDYKTFIMPRKSKTHKYGGIHRICILVKNAYASNYSVVTKFMSESALWLHISKSVIGY